VINTPTVTFANGVTVVNMPQANLTALLLGLGGVAGLLSDYAVMRDQARACETAGGR
jgi:hypothetical protein